MWLKVSDDICRYVFLKDNFVNKEAIKIYENFGFNIKRFVPVMVDKGKPFVTFDECEILDTQCACWVLFSDAKDFLDICEEYGLRYVSDEDEDE